MNVDRPSWDDLRIFAAIAATGSLTGAAGQLRLSQPTVGRRLQALEECLGAALLERTPRGMQLTAKGQALLPLVQQMEQAGDAIDRAAPGLADLPLGTVRIAAGPWNSRFMARRFREPAGRAAGNRDRALQRDGVRQPGAARGRHRDSQPAAERRTRGGAPPAGARLRGVRRALVRRRQSGGAHRRPLRAVQLDRVRRQLPDLGEPGVAARQARALAAGTLQPTPPRSTTRCSAARGSRSFRASPARRMRASCACRRR